VLAKTENEKGKCIRNGNSSRETLEGAKYDYDYPQKKVGFGGGKQFVECEQQVSGKDEGPVPARDQLSKLGN